MITRGVRHWWATPILLPRWVLTVKYGVFVAIGALTGFTGIIDVTTAVGIERFMALLVMASGIIAAVGSVSDRLEPVERWACAGVIIGMCGAITGAILAAHGPISVGLLILLVLITLLAVARLVSLLLKLGGTPR